MWSKSVDLGGVGLEVVALANQIFLDFMFFPKYGAVNAWKGGGWLNDVEHTAEAGADPGFPVGGGANMWFCQNFQKTAWNWENFGRPLLDLPLQSATPDAHCQSQFSTPKIHEHYHDYIAL